MLRWEYQTVIFEASLWLSSGELDGEAFQGKLEEMGKAGWELVSVFDTNRQQGVTYQVVAVFKRGLT
jgi:hypothetical protein